MSDPRLRFARRALCVAPLAWLAPRAAATRPPEAPASASYAEHAAAEAFAAEMAERHQWPRHWIAGRLAQARRQPAVQRLIMPAASGVAKNWRAYRERFVERERIASGLAFWQQHEAWLQQAWQRFGVPPEIVLAILGVETFYGRVMGEFRVIDALATLAFDFPPGRRDRSAFFRGELEQLFLWCAREGLDPLTPRGSYAGAIGLPQFMPSSINRYAVDFDTDGHVDLRTSAPDVVGSVARYLAEFGWTRDQPTHFAVQPPSPGENLAALRQPDIVPTFSAAQMAERGATLAPAAQDHDGPLALVELENAGSEPSYVAGTRNFYVITRYNWSAYYAMAVIDLAQALRAAR